MGPLPSANFSHLVTWKRNRSGYLASMRRAMASHAGAAMIWYRFCRTCSLQYEQRKATLVSPESGHGRRPCIVERTVGHTLATAVLYVGQGAHQLLIMVPVPQAVARHVLEGPVAESDRLVSEDRCFPPRLKAVTPHLWIAHSRRLACKASSSVFDMVPRGKEASSWKGTPPCHGPYQKMSLGRDKVWSTPVVAT
jgi:hypothetical protein